MSPRNRELFGLIPASLLVTAGFAGVFIQRSQALSNISLTYGAIFLGLCLAGHIFIRTTLPNADPYLFPLVAVLASFGLVMIYRLDATYARQQAQWFVLGLVLFAGTIIAFRDYRKLERYRYIIVAVSLGLMILPRFPVVGYQANGAYLGVRIPGLFVFQPPEFTKIGLVIFLASYLRDTRQLLVVGARRFLGITIPPFKHFGPVCGHLGSGHGDPRPALRRRHLGDVLRRAPGHALRGHQPGLVRGRRGGRGGDRLLVPGHPHPAHSRPRRDVAEPAQPQALQRAPGQLPGRQRALCPGRGRALRSGVRAGGDRLSGRRHPAARLPTPT